MANYKKIEENIYVEQNIYDNDEIESYEAKHTFDGNEKTAVLYYYSDGDDRFYSLGLLENLNLDTITIVCDDLTNVFKFKTGRTRRKYIYELILENE